MGFLYKKSNTLLDLHKVYFLCWFYYLYILVCIINKHIISKVSKSSKMKGHHFDYKRVLNGKFNYYSSEVRDELGFEGFIKLSKDP